MRKKQPNSLGLRTGQKAYLYDTSSDKILEHHIVRANFTNVRVQRVISNDKSVEFQLYNETLNEDWWLSYNDTVQALLNKQILLISRTKKVLGEQMDRLKVINEKFR